MDDTFLFHSQQSLYFLPSFHLLIMVGVRLDFFPLEILIRQEDSFYQTRRLAITM